MRGIWRGAAVVGLVAAALITTTGMGARQPTNHPMGNHMAMTVLRPMQAGEKERAEEILAGARRAAVKYANYKTALAEYFIFLSKMPQKVYHFGKMNQDELAFDPAEPPGCFTRRHLTDSRFML